MRKITCCETALVACAAWFAACAAAWGATTGVSYTHYRFKVDAVYGTSAIGMQISELALLCDGENVTRKHLESVRARRRFRGPWRIRTRPGRGTT